MNKPKGRISTNWNSNLAYAVGLIASDGYLSSDGRHMELTSVDMDQLENFSRCLGIKCKIGKKISGYTNRKDCFRLQFGDVVFYNWLVGVGLETNKSKTLKMLKIPDKYFFDFLRGYFDGDGSIYSYFDPRWKSSFMFYISFVSASNDFLIWVRDSIFRLSGFEGKISFSSRVNQLRFAKKASRCIIEKMFYSENVVCLNRKIRKIEDIIRIDNTKKSASGETGKHATLRG